MRVLVTGGNGFVGKHVIRELRERGHDVVAPTKNELNLLIPRIWVADDSSAAYSGASTVALDFIQYKCDAIVHLAATCGGIGINKDNPGKFIYENLQMGINVLEGARLAKIKKVVNLATVCAYPKYTPVPFQEKDIWNGYPEETNAPYGIAKKTIMEMGVAYARQYDMKIANLVPANMAGEYDHFDDYSSHVVPAIIKKFENSGNKSITLWGTGNASREFLYAGDCARAIAVSLERDTGSQPINIGTSYEVTIKELAELIKKIGHYDAEIIWDVSKPDGQPRRKLDVTRAKEVLRWEAVVPLEETIKRTIEWYRAQ